MARASSGLAGNSVETAPASFFGSFLLDKKELVYLARGTLDREFLLLLSAQK